MRMGHWTGALALAGTVAMLGFAPNGEATGTRPDPERYRSTAEDRESVAITVYNQNFGLVREVRGLDLARGTVELEFGTSPPGSSRRPCSYALSPGPAR